MRVKALCSFSGSITMSKGEIRECDDEAVLSDLIRAGYVEEKTAQKTEKTTTATAEAKSAKKAVKPVENQ